MILYMKKRSKILFYLFIVTLISCSEQNIVNEVGKYNFDYFKHKYSNYYTDSIIQSPNKCLVYEYDSLSKQEMILFDENDVCFEYVFYNISNDEPRYIMYFDSLLNVVSQDGKALYIASPDFRKNSIKDSFEVNVYLATPPEFNYDFTLFYVDNSGNSSQITKHIVKDDVFTKYIGQRKRIDDKEDYYIISKIWSNTFERYDTAYFTIINGKRLPN